MIDWGKIYEETKDKGEGPFYTDYLYNVQKDYPNIGLASCDWGNAESSDIPYLLIHKGQLIDKFNTHYALREIGSETETRWQWTINIVFDRIKHKYNHYFMMYEQNDIEELGRRLEETYNLSRHSVNKGKSDNTTNTSDKSSGTSTFLDTPIQKLLEDGDYATNRTRNDAGSSGLSKSNGNSENEVTTTDGLVREKNENDSSVLEQVNQNIDIWRDLLMSFIYEFKTCFINELGKV